MQRTAERGGCFWDYDKGICLGCPLSPLMGEFFLHDQPRRRVISTKMIIPAGCSVHAPVK